MEAPINKGERPAPFQRLESIAAHSCQISQFKTKVLAVTYDAVVYGTINQREKFLRDENCALWGFYAA
jgi:hypothetical protein